ncbi:uncharacterized protein LOC125658542 isoform X2 [Ostrea edulis]|uniref:uncharacterized protein LOC125658542 isoform X2 n=1 Tax=Ostrea edulis TaxID=37623 RepID=UPI0024AF2344|nr:uncharacterized protein LOC125658542 isoform X2 [Ostrea edulis]
MEDLSDEDILHLDNEKVPSFIGSRRGFTHSSGFYEEERGENQSLQEVLVIGVPDIDTDSDDSYDEEEQVSFQNEGGKPLPLPEEVIVRRNYIFLKDELSVRWIYHFLHQEDVLSIRDLEDICGSPKPRHVQIDALLKLLLRYGRTACNKFVNILQAPECGYAYIVDTFQQTRDCRTKEDWSAYQREITVDHIRAEHAFLSRSMEPVPTADFILQELREDVFSIYDHDEVQNEVSKLRQARVLLNKITKKDDVILNCFLCAVEIVRNVLPGVSIIERLKNKPRTKTKDSGQKRVGVFFQDEHLVKVVDADMRYDDDSGDHVIIFRFRNQQRRKIQELENVLVRRIHNMDSEIDELATRFMRMSIQDCQAGSIVLYVKALTDNAAEILDKNQLKMFIQKVLQDPEMNRLLPAGTLQLQVETITSGFVEGELWEIDRSCLMEVLADNRAMLEDELEPYRFLPRFRKEGLFSQEEVDLIKGQNIRRNRANEFLRLLQGKGKPALEVFVDELKKLNESYILQQLFPSTSTSTQCRDCLRNAILDNYEDIRDEIDVKISDYSDPPCHAAYALFKDSSERYRSPQALIKHVLECDTALVRFHKVTRSTPIAGLTEFDCNCTGYRDFTSSTQRKQRVYNYRISSVLLKKENPVSTKTEGKIPFTDLVPAPVLKNREKSSLTNSRDR